jgi:hypothetical protein
MIDKHLKLKTQMTNREIYITETTHGNRTLYGVNVFGYPEFSYGTWDKEQANTEGIEEANQFLNNIPENTNKLFANIMTRIMEYVNKYDYFPNDYYELLDLQTEFSLDKMSYEDYDYAVYQLAVRWFKPDSLYKK